MAIIRIQKWQFIPPDQIDNVIIRSMSLNEQEKNDFYAFGQCFRQFLDTALEKPENMLTSCL